ncbi:unnamed protein product [Polarella glacialis]|uniref:Phosphate transporter n=2 Tax=Polarella glacialis TaxID=89957 RepID=A0A813JN05_POLGL|nr:unnamed protein product [Polarella glacialis]
MLGGLGEFMGATFLGAGVSSTIQKGVADLTSPVCWACGYCDSKMAMYQWGMLAALIGGAVFLLLSTFFCIPVSTTHAIVGGVVGMTWLAVGGGCLNWSVTSGLGAIILSWVLSPLLAGFVACAMYLINYFLVFKARDPVEAAFVAVPLLYGLTCSVMLYLILLKSPLTAKSVSANARLIICSVVLVVVPLAVKFCVNPVTRRDINLKWAKGNGKGNGNESSESSGSANPTPANAETLGVLDLGSVGQTQEVRIEMEEHPHGRQREEVEGLEGHAEVPEGLEEAPKGMQIFHDWQGCETQQQLGAKRVFKSLLVLVAFLESFAHGANDTGNATGPFGAILNTYSNGIYACNGEPTPIYVMAIAGFFVALGVNVMGYRVIKTMGTDLCFIDFHLGFCTEFASGFSVVLATILKMPVSTTHCQVGAVIFVGALARGPRNVSWSLFGKIFLTWVITLPFSGGLAALITFLRFL